jgi:hypothetical protein
VSETWFAVLYGADPLEYPDEASTAPPLLLEEAAEQIKLCLWGVVVNCKP